MSYTSKISGGRICLCRSNQERVEAKDNVLKGYSSVSEMVCPVCKSFLTVRHNEGKK